MKLAKLNDGPEIFYSIQGEGKSTGQPSIFIRSSLCNLHCFWCDTDYTWNWTGTRFKHFKDDFPGYKKFKKEDQIIELGTDEIISELKNVPCRNLVFTGGEPLLQDEAWVDLMRSLQDSDTEYWFEVETNGTLLPSQTFDQFIHQYNVSPKLANSGNPVRLRYRKKVLDFFSDHPKSTFKFVICKPEDKDEILDLIAAHNIPNEKVWLMPEGTDEKTLKANQAMVMKICLNFGFHYSDRLHVRLFGDKRGV